MRFLHTSWSDIQRLCEVVARKIAASGYKPDLVVAISRGGFAPARILCDLLNVDSLASVSIKYYEEIGTRREKPEVEYPLNADVDGKRVLIVDDVADTGHSLLTAKEHVLALGAKDVKVATLHYKPWSAFKPDYYGETTEAWIVYVWEVRETIKDLAKKFRNEGLNEGEIVERLTSIGFDEEIVRKTLRGEI